MPRITLVENAATCADHILQMTAMPMNVQIAGLAGGPAVFTCTNAIAAIRGASSMKITYDATHRGPPTETIQVSSVIA